MSDIYTCFYKQNHHISLSLEVFCTLRTSVSCESNECIVYSEPYTLRRYINKLQSLVEVTQVSPALPLLAILVIDFGTANQEQEKNTRNWYCDVPMEFVICLYNSLHMDTIFVTKIYQLIYQIHTN